MRSWSKQVILPHSRRLAFGRQLPTWIRQDLQDEYHTFVSEALSRARRLDHPRGYLIQQLTQSTAWLLQSWEICSESFLRRSLPFHSREAIELAFSSHPLDLAWPPKKLLRGAFDGLVPSTHLHRVSKDGGESSDSASVPIDLGPIPESIADLINPAILDITVRQSPDVVTDLVPLAVAARRAAQWTPVRYSPKGGEQRDGNQLSTASI